MDKALRVIGKVGAGASEGGHWPTLSQGVWVQIGVTVALLLGSAILRAVVLRAIRRKAGLSPHIRRRWIIQTRRLMLGLLAVLLIVVWATQLKLAVLSVAAVAAATVLAAKELIECVSGSLMRSSNRMFDIGDRIEIGDYRGDVIDHSLLATTILEVGPGASSHQTTGRAVVIPNSMLLDKPVVNESFTKTYALHTVTVGLDPRKDDWQLAERCLLKAAGEACASYMAKAAEEFEAMSDQQGLEMPSLEPRVILQLSDANKTLLILRMVVPSRRKGRVEQAVLRRYLGLVGEGAAKVGQPESADDSTI